MFVRLGSASRAALQLFSVAAIVLGMVAPATAQETRDLTQGLADGVDDFDDVIRVAGARVQEAEFVIMSPVDGVVPPEGPSVVAAGSTYFSDPDIASFGPSTLNAEYPFAFDYRSQDQAYFNVATGFVAHAMIIDGLDPLEGWGQFVYAEAATFLTRSGQELMVPQPGIDNDPGEGASEVSSLLSERGEPRAVLGLPSGLFTSPYYIAATPLGGGRVQVTHLTIDPTASVRFVFSYAYKQDSIEDLGFLTFDSPPPGTDEPFNTTDDYSDLGIQWRDDWLLPFETVDAEGDGEVIAGGDDEEEVEPSGAAQTVPGGENEAEDGSADGDQATTEPESSQPSTTESDSPPAEESPNPSWGTIIAILAAGGTILLVILLWLRQRNSKPGPVGTTPPKPAETPEPTGIDGWTRVDVDDLEDYDEGEWNWLWDNAPDGADWEVWEKDGDLRVGTKSDPEAFPPVKPPRRAEPLTLGPSPEDVEPLGSSMQPLDPDLEVREGAKDDPEMNDQDPPVEPEGDPWWGPGGPPVGPRDEFLEEQEKLLKEQELDRAANEQAVRAAPVFGVIDIVSGVPDGQVARRKRLQDIADRFKGTGDIAGVAEALYEFDQWHQKTYDEGWFNWTNDSGAGTMSRAENLTEFVSARRLCCFEFIHLCAYLSSDWPIIEARNDEGVVSSEVARWGLTARVIRVTSTAPIDGDPARGQVVTGVAYMGTRNQAGYTHTVISVGDGEVIGLGTGGFEKESFDATFQYYYGADLLQGPYGYGAMSPSPLAPDPGK